MSLKCFKSTMTAYFCLPYYEVGNYIVYYVVLATKVQYFIASLIVERIYAVHLIFYVITYIKRITTAEKISCANHVQSVFN